MAGAREFPLIALAAAAIALSPAARAAPADPAAAQIGAFDEALVATMKVAKGESLEQRYRRLEPAVDRAYDFPLMTRFAVGPRWTSFTPAQQQALTGAFERLTVATYAHELSGYGGERIELEPKVATTGPDKLVTTRLISPGQAPVTIAYRMRQAGGAWKIVDVYYDAISQVVTRRSDFAALVEKGGAPALLAHLKAMADKQMK